MDEGFRRHPTSMGRRADIRLDHEVPPPCAGLRATRIRRRNPHHHRRNRNPSQAMALSLLKHALRHRRVGERGQSDISGLLKSAKKH